METKLLIAAFTVVFYVQLSSALDIRNKCQPGLYFNLKREKCTPCTFCKRNQVPLVQCHSSRDTLCGTLGNFEFRQKSYGKDTKTEVTFELPKKESEDRTTETSTTMVADDKWFAITMVLVGILVFTCVLGVILVFVTCYMCKRKEREIICDPVYTSSLIKDGQITEPTYQQFKIITEARQV